MYYRVDAYDCIIVKEVPEDAIPIGTIFGYKDYKRCDDVYLFIEDPLPLDTFLGSQDVS
uniref:Uncharacterized protein n=1 Tax=viral metagenome TaxID=1070528 RepID=A0A6M3JEG1_9ZZZZ